MLSVFLFQYRMASFLNRFRRQAVLDKQVLRLAALAKAILYANTLKRCAHFAHQRFGNGRTQPADDGMLFRRYHRAALPGILLVRTPHPAV